MKNIYKFMAAAMLLMTVGFNSFAWDVKWNGSVSSDWADPANWTIVGDTVDEADGVSGYFVDSMFIDTMGYSIDLWVKEWADPSIGEYWYQLNDSVGARLGGFSIYIDGEAENTCVSTWETPNNFNKSLSNGHWTRADFLKVSSGAQLEWGFKNWHTNYIDLDGVTILTDTSYIRAAKSYAIGRDGGGWVFLNDTSTMDVKSIYYFGKTGSTQVIEGEDTSYVDYSYKGKIVVNDKSNIWGGQYGYDLRTQNGSQLIVNGGTAHGPIRDLSTLDTACVVVNAGEFQCTNDYLSVFLAAGVSIITDNGGDLVITEVDTNEDGTTDYVSITNSLNTPVTYDPTDPQVSVRKVEQELEMTLYPNPSKDGVFNVNAASEKMNVTVYNTLGQQVFNRSYFGQNVSVDANLSKGIYLVEVTADGARSVQKLIVEK